VKKILFISSTNNISTGSYRIWVNDLNQYFQECGIPSVISHGIPGSVSEHDIIICGKSDAEAAAAVKKAFPEKKVGVINLSSDRKNLPVDFVIVGSMEEMDSLSHYDNVFLYPLIERMYQSPGDYKKHEESSVLRIGFHGHYPHLSKFCPYLDRALESLEKKHEIELLIVTTNTSFEWRVGKPNIKNIIMKKWDVNTIKEDLLSCDIGIVPNVTNLSLQELKLGTSVDMGLYNTDHVVRMKNKSNAGRCFVFHQLGIPVVADLTPSNFHIMGDPKCGFLALNQASWLKALKKLADPETRQDIADNAKREFDRLYNPHEWAQRLYKDLSEI
jgi:glycosyltransferase involved in cell wall biosynthesis